MLHATVPQWDQAHWPSCWCWMWPPKPTFHSECRVPWPVRLPQDTSILCWPNCICPQWYQEPVAPCDHHMQGSNGSYLVQGIGGGQYRHANDHIWECHHDAVKPCTSNHWWHSTSCIHISSFHLGIEIANSCFTCNTNTSCTNSYTANSMQSSACSTFTTTKMMPSTRAPPCQTGTAPAVLHWSTQNRKPPSRLLEDIDLDCSSQINLMMPWPRLSLVQLLKCCALN